MSNKIQEVADSLIGHAKSHKTTAKELKNKSLKDALKDKSLPSKKEITETVFLKSRRLAAIELMREKLQAIIDTKGWADEVKALFPDATFQIIAHKGKIIIEVSA